ncbi:hypothetical protein [Ferrimicrobium sp.]|uniref:hypothetical protein n=1 Tax=Ferrimicrobium sp. TaxID=2926050 RepID=UPI00262EE2ED|nr:hypothetical protein [Ferrimicrobium sp.]
MRRRQMALMAVTMMTTSTVLAACGTSSSSATPAKAPSAKVTITKTFQTFFDGSSAAATKIRLLQNGSAFSPVIKAQASSSIAKGTSAKVSNVTLVSPVAATVTYTIYLGGQPALKDQHGEAVKVDGTWKVGDASFCNLISLEGAKVPACATFEKNS